MADSNSSGGIGFVGLLTLVFITLKLIDKIDWSWWWVLSPIWISGAFCLFVVSCVLITAYLSGLFGTSKRRSRR